MGEPQKALPLMPGIWKISYAVLVHLFMCWHLYIPENVLQNSYFIQDFH